MPNSILNSADQQNKSDVESFDFVSTECRNVWEFYGVSVATNVLPMNFSLESLCCIQDDIRGHRYDENVSEMLNKLERSMLMGLGSPKRSDSLKTNRESTASATVRGRSGSQSNKMFDSSDS